MKAREKIIEYAREACRNAKGRNLNNGQQKKVLNQGSKSEDGRFFALHIEDPREKKAKL